MLTHADIKQQGLYLTQTEAQEMQGKVSGISQGHITDGIVYPVIKEIPKADPLRDYYLELQRKNKELLSENAALIIENSKLTHEINDLRSPSNKLNDEIIKNGFTFSGTANDFKSEKGNTAAGEVVKRGRPAKS